MSFSILENEIVGLIGPNGSGKTTLLECLAGFPADDGEVEFRGTRVVPSARKGVLFYLPDGIRPWADERVRNIVAFFANVYRAGDRVKGLLRDLDIARFTEARAGSLSKGELKRLLLAIGLLTPHPLLLLDEPFDGLDFRQARDVMAVLRAESTKRTLFLSIHQLNDAERVCDRVVLLNRGRVAGEGTIAELRDRARVPTGGLEEIFLALT